SYVDTSTARQARRAGCGVAGLLETRRRHEPTGPQDHRDDQLQGRCRQDDRDVVSGDVVSSFSGLKVLVFDLDAQMSLTQAIALNEATGALHDKFQKWYDVAIERK